MGGGGCKEKKGRRGSRLVWIVWRISMDRDRARVVYNTCVSADQCCIEGEIPHSSKMCLCLTKKVLLVSLVARRQDKGNMLYNNVYITLCDWRVQHHSCNALFSFAMVILTNLPPPPPPPPPQKKKKKKKVQCTVS